MDKLKTAINKLSKLIEDNESISMPLLSVKLKQASGTYPEDKTVGMVSHIISRMIDNNKISISRKEFKDLYQKFYTINTKFANIFEKELGNIDKMQGTTAYEKEEYGPEMTMDKIVADNTDPSLLNSLNGVFGMEVKPYTEKQSEVAIKMCKSYFGSINPVIKVADGNEKIIVCHASFTTPKGTTSVLVPVEVADTIAKIPTVFIGNDGPEVLNLDNIKAYVLSHSGQAIKFAASQVCDILNSKNESSVVDYIVAKVNASKDKQIEKTAFIKDLEDTKYDTIKFEEAIGKASTINNQAIFKFGKDMIINSHNAVIRKLNEIGYKIANIQLDSFGENNVCFAVSLGKAAFKVPVKMVNGKINLPEYMLVNGSVMDLTQEHIQNLMNEKLDTQTYIKASPLFASKPSELVDIVKAETDNKNYVKAEEALLILQHSEASNAYTDALNYYIKNINIEKSENKITCSMVVNSKNSIHKVCGHTGLPLNKVYQDENGECKPLYRKGMDKQYDVVHSLNSKIFGV